MIAIVIPTYKEAADLTINEKISFLQTTKIFKNYNIFLATHKDVNTGLYQLLAFKDVNLRTIVFDRSYFEGLEGYNKLLMSIDFYKAFKNYRYLLICQLDVFVFYDNLKYYTQSAIDYIGAPWFEAFDNATKKSRIIGVGNGGFSLRKVSSFILVLHILNFFKNPFSGFWNFLSAVSHPVSFLKVVKHQFSYNKNKSVSLVPGEFPFYEDKFWGLNIYPTFPWFKVGSINDAVSFAFEVNPEVLYEMNDKQLPMATHAWEKYNPEFWKPFIESYGYKLDASVS
jgi:hypothetical protein